MLKGCDGFGCGMDDANLVLLSVCERIVDYIASVKAKMGEGCYVLLGVCETSKCHCEEGRVLYTA